MCFRIWRQHGTAVILTTNRHLIFISDRNTAKNLSQYLFWKMVAPWILKACVFAVVIMTPIIPLFVMNLAADSCPMQGSHLREVQLFRCSSMVFSDVSSIRASVMMRVFFSTTMEAQMNGISEAM